jgi:hypothetical protein
MSRPPTARPSPRDDGHRSPGGLPDRHRSREDLIGLYNNAEALHQPATADITEIERSLEGVERLRRAIAMIRGGQLGPDRSGAIAVLEEVRRLEVDALSWSSARHPHCGVLRTWTVTEQDRIKSALARIWTKVLAQIRQQGRKPGTTRP